MGSRSVKLEKNKVEHFKNLMNELALYTTSVEKKGELLATLTDSLRSASSEAAIGRLLIAKESVDRAMAAQALISQTDRDIIALLNKMSSDSEVDNALIEKLHRDLEEIGQYPQLKPKLIWLEEYSKRHRDSRIAKMGRFGNVGGFRTRVEEYILNPIAQAIEHLAQH